MPEQEALSVKTDLLKKEAEKLRAQYVEQLAQNPPIKSGEGHMADQMDEMVQTMTMLYQKSNDLIEATAQMLEKMGIAFEETERTVSGFYQKNN